jgi:hypothetical protein
MYRQRIMPDAQSEQPTRGVGRGRYDLERRKRQIEARLVSIKARDGIKKRKRETRANIVIGAVMRSHSALHPAFLTTLATILNIGVRRQTDRELLASILGVPRLILTTDTYSSEYSSERTPVGLNGSPAPSCLMPSLRCLAREVTMLRCHS